MDPVGMTANIPTKTGIEIMQVFLYAIVAGLGSIATVVGSVLARKIMKKDCTDCISVKELHGTMSVMASILYDVAMKLGVDCKALIKREDYNG